MRSDAPCQRLQFSSDLEMPLERWSRTKPERRASKMPGWQARPASGSTLPKSRRFLPTGTAGQAVEGGHYCGPRGGRGGAGFGSRTAWRCRTTSWPPSGAWNSLASLQRRQGQRSCAAAAEAVELAGSTTRKLG
ncbi:putative U3 small nucleolar RNA-associated protein 18-like protein isoform X1 [Microtus ochrogaster]|uniref:Putative U3 small nucleolar RNA-associated protein 18-like protein isoform X1 n=1 Tax=Microtus ochrogaster TaxID=79684 RepID=A0A8J6GHK1_MICOH|nr:putative U3 small nucleolar RNA-associated protein 18-like protein isoform X1 [Microtus ochrogaster]